MLGDFLDHPGAAWLIVAMLLGIAEIVLPGFFLVFLAGAAAATAAVTILLPGLPLAAQLLIAAVLSGASVALGRRWYKASPVDSTDPLLNARGARLIGEQVTVVVAIAQGQGRVRVGDGEWSATGPDAPIGARVRIVGVSGATLIVEPA